MLSFILLLTVASNRPPVERRDAATIVTLERAWNEAYLTGDTDFERDLLTPDFTEILAGGRVVNLSYELALAERNRGKPPADAPEPHVRVTIHDDAAVAFGVSSNGRMRYADYYVWDGTRWRVYFAQQTRLTP